MNHKTYKIKGNKIHSISDFYQEINRLFMKNEDWNLGESLDALDDLLYGGYGDLFGLEKIIILWENSEESKKSLGYETTKIYYESKISQPQKYNVKKIKIDLKELQENKGKTYFEIIIEIFKSHKNIELILQ